MDPFVRRLVRRLSDRSRPMSRNRHFHVFRSPEGRLALKLWRRLMSLQRDILACAEQERAATYLRLSEENGQRRIELRLERVRGYRVSLLSEAEFELLGDLPGVRAALHAAEAPSQPGGA
jgi:hypothetical protein